MCQTLFEGALF